jgi:hypothetical protein
MAEDEPGVAYTACFCRRELLLPASSSGNPALNQLMPATCSYRRPTIELDAGR